MEIIKDFSEKEKLKRNVVLVQEEGTSLVNSAITFQGKNNILVVEKGAKICNSKIDFRGSNCVCYLSGNHHIYYLDVVLNESCCVFVGSNCYMNGTLHLIASEHQNILIGKDGLFSFGIFVRTADPHLIYDCTTKERVNESRSVLLGDHIWVGQNVLLLKGTTAGSGSVIGGGSVVAGKRVPSNVVVGGNPGTIIRRNIFFSEESVHAWKKKDTRAAKIMDTDQWIYARDENTRSLKKIDRELKKKRDAREKLAYLEQEFVERQEKNRFYQGEKKPEKKKHRFLFGSRGKE